MLRRRRESVPDPANTTANRTAAGQANTSAIGAITEPLVSDLGNPRIAAAASAVDRGDLAGTTAAYDSSPNWNERIAIVHTVAKGEQRRAQLDQWATIQPSHPCVAAAVGWSTIARAWDARGSGRASTVSDGGAERFHELLRAAEVHLETMLRLDPQSPLPWTLLLTSGRGLSISVHELTFRFEQSWARSPDLLETHQQYLQGLCGKWLGTDDMMQAFVNNVVSAAPLGSPLHSLRIDEQIELAFSNDVSLEDMFTHNTNVIQGVADRSVARPEMDDAPERVDSLIARNKVALAFLLAGRPAAADEQFRTIAGRYTDEPWTMFADEPIDAVVRMRADAAGREPADR